VLQTAIREQRYQMNKPAKELKTNAAT